MCGCVRHQGGVVVGGWIMVTDVTDARSRQAPRRDVGSLVEGGSHEIKWRGLQGYKGRYPLSVRQPTAARNLP